MIDTLFVYLFIYFSTGLLSMALALLELALEITLEITEILLLIPPECWDQKHGALPHSLVRNLFKNLTFRLKG